MHKKALLLTSLSIFLSFNLFSADLNYTVTKQGDGEDAQLIISPTGGSDNVEVSVNGNVVESVISGDDIIIGFDDKKFAYLRLEKGKASKGKLLHFRKGNSKPKHLPLWLSILPPLIAILIALLTKEVVTALFSGVWVGAWVINGLSLKGLFVAFLDAIGKFVVDALSDKSHIAVIVFSLIIGGMVSLISRNGGMAGIVNRLSRFAVSAKKSQLITWVLGLAIFFDDYANTLIVGNTMRSLTDRFRVSREKLAYIVDSTAAPISAIALVTTWIGAELGYIQSALPSMPGLEDASTYGLFINSLKYSFYPVLAIVFMLILITNRLDFGPMLKIERYARKTGDVTGVDLTEKEATANDETEELTPVEGKPHRALNAILPIITVILGTLIGLFYTGGYTMSMGIPNGEQLRTVIGDADSYSALIWGSSAGLLMAVLLTLGGRIMNLKDSVSAIVKGFKTMLAAVVILVLAWALAKTTQELFTADFITGILGDNFSPFLFPAITFIMSALIAFSTGSSWSTMAILYPLVLPAVWKISQASGIDPDMQMEILYNTISVVLAGSVFGDHCSPISDTTILSSLASKCNHLSHVKTQLPYAVVVGVISILIGGLFVFLRLPALVNFAVAIFIAYVAARLLGKNVDDYVVE